MDLILIRSLSFNINIGSAQTYNSLSAQGNLQSNVWILMKSILLSNRMKSIFRRLKSRFCWKVVISAISLRISKWQLIQKINLSIEHCLVFIQTRTSGDHALAGSQDWTVFQIPNFLKISCSPGSFLFGMIHMTLFTKSFIGFQWSGLWWDPALWCFKLSRVLKEIVSIQYLLEWTLMGFSFVLSQDSSNSENMLNTF